MSGFEAIVCDHNGFTLEGIVARPQGQGPFPAVMVMHSALGLRHQVPKTAEKLAALGYLAVATDMYGAEIQAGGISNRVHARHPAVGEILLHPAAALARRDEPDVGGANPQDRLERLLVVVPLRCHDSRGLASSLFHHGLERLERRDDESHGSRRLLQVALLVGLDDANDVVVEGQGRARQCVGDRGRPDDHQTTRTNARLHVHIHGPLRDTHHRYDHVFRVRTVRGGGVGPDRHEPCVTKVKAFERLLPDDLPRARAADGQAPERPLA